MTTPAHDFYVLVVTWCPLECYPVVNDLGEARVTRQLHSVHLALGMRS